MLQLDIHFFLWLASAQDTHRSSSTGLALGFTYVDLHSGAICILSIPYFPHFLQPTTVVAKARDLLRFQRSYIIYNKIRNTHLSSVWLSNLFSWKMRLHACRILTVCSVVYLLRESWLHPIVPPSSITIWTTYNGRKLFGAKNSFIKQPAADFRCDSSAPRALSWCWLIYISYQQHTNT